MVIKKKESSDYQTLLNCLWIDEGDIKVGREIGIGEFGGKRDLLFFYLKHCLFKLKLNNTLI